LWVVEDLLEMDRRRGRPRGLAIAATSRAAMAETTTAVVTSEAEVVDELYSLLVREDPATFHG
jgi:hypothetical protein